MRHCSCRVLVANSLDELHADFMSGVEGGMWGAWLAGGCCAEICIHTGRLVLLSDYMAGSPVSWIKAFPCG